MPQPAPESTPACVIIQNRPLIARLLLLFWLAEVTVGLLFVAAGVKLWGPQENGGAAMLMLMGAVLSAAGAVMTGLCWRVSRIRGAAIELSAEGLLDRRLSLKRLPWEAIRWKVIFNGRSYSLQLDLTEPVRSESRIFWPQRALGLFSKTLRQPEFTVVTLGTGLSAHQLAQRFETYKPAAAAS